MTPFLEAVDARLAEAFATPRNLVFGHIGDNNLHLVTTTGREEDLEQIGDIVYEVTGAHGGSISGEHGIGTLRRPYLHHSRSPAEIALMRQLKRCLDPKGILNPGRVIEV
jgi:FAD/FMN-containing dehydrogenase